MTVRVIGRLSADPGLMEKLFAERKDDFVSVQKDSIQRGAKHHEFLNAGNELMILDEWESAEAFQSFFADQPIIASIMGELGVAGPPTFEVYEVMDSPDKF
jgi:heme-degrading monooxygenase HmoA